MSPRSSCRYGRSFSYQAPVPPKINLFTSKWSPISSVPSIDADGILKACTMKLVPNSARITVTSSDSRYSEIVVWSARCSCFFSGIRLSLSLPRARVVPKRSAPHVAPLLFSCCPRPSPCTPPQSKLRSGKPFGGRGRSLPLRDIQQAPAPVLARVPAGRTCDPTPRCAHRAPREPARTESFATPRAPHPVRHRGKPRLLPLRTHRPAASASLDRRFSLPRAPAASALPGAAAAQPLRGILHLQSARGSWKAALRSTPENSPGDIRSSAARGRHLRETPAARCPGEAKQRQPLPRLLRAIRGLLNCGSAPSRGAPLLKTCTPNAPQTLRPQSGWSLA